MKEEKRLEGEELGRKGAMLEESNESIVEAMEVRGCMIFPSFCDKLFCH